MGKKNNPVQEDGGLLPGWGTPGRGNQHKLCFGHTYWSLLLLCNVPVSVCLFSAISFRVYSVSISTRPQLKYHAEGG